MIMNRLYWSTFYLIRLSQINRVIFKLCPYDISFLFIFSDLKPKSFLNDSLNKITIIPISYKDLKWRLVFLYVKFAIYIIAVVYDKYKLFVFVHFDVDAVLSIFVEF